MTSAAFSEPWRMPETHEEFRYSGFPARALIVRLMACATENDSAMEDGLRSPSPQVAVIMAR
jgi:hypothetical protein